MNLLDATLAAGAQITNKSAWCREHGVDRRTFYRHEQRVQAEGPWQPRSRRPDNCPHALPEQIAQLIVELRTLLAPDNGADYIRDRLAKIAVEQDWAGRGWRVPSRSTINRVLARRGLLARNPRKRPRSSWRRFSYARPRDCYQIDATEYPLATGHTVVIFDVLDDCTRTLVACHAARAETTDAAITAITSAFDEFGAPGIVLCDNGAVFTARHRHDNAGPTRFARHVTTAGTRLIHSSPYHPQTCGKVERHHQTLKRWLATQPPPATLARLQALLDRYRAYYNTERAHSALGRRTPHHAWHTAPALGGPHHPPAQTDATVHQLTATTQGTITVGRGIRLHIGRDHARQAITVIRDGQRLTAYTTDGTPIGHHTIDPTKHYQGKITPAT